MISCPTCNQDQTETSTYCSVCGAALKPELLATVTQENRGSPAASSDHASTSGSSHHGQFLPGTKVADRYRIVSLVGRGGMGEVYRADDLKLGHTVALKFLPKDLANDPKRLEYFHSEVRLTRQISHPNVCRVYDIGQYNGQHFLSMEYIDGEDLRLLLRRIGGLPQAKGVQIAQQLCAGLAAAHDRGVLHRDLKPANVMIDGRGQVRITDFGLARLAGQGDQWEIAGTPAYMAPEQLAEGKTTIQSDLYSLGLILREMMTGEPTFKTGSLAELRQVHNESTWSNFSSEVEDLDPVTARVIQRCLEREPAARYPSAHAVAAALPGGNPLAAALAAGQTPTPEMVAQAGTSSGLSLRAATTCLLLVLGGVAIACGLADYTYLTNRIDAIESISLRDAAEDFLEQLEYLDANQDQDIAFGIGGGGQDWLDPSPFFWYRRSPEKGALVVNEFFDPYMRDLIGRLGRTTLSAPARRKPGEVSMVLSVDGLHLLWFQVVGSTTPDLSESAEDEQSKLQEITQALEEKFRFGVLSDWRPVSSKDAALAQLLAVTSTNLSKSSPNYPGTFDHFAVFQSTNETDEEKKEEFLAGSYWGKLVYFASLDRKRSVEQKSDSFWSNVVLPIQINAWSVFLLAITVVSSGLVVRNLQLGRVDRRTAFRGATAVFAMCMIIWLISAHHAPWTQEFTVLQLGVAHAMVSAGFFLMWYVAIEPMIRRIWPDALVTWVRLASGRIYDPVVGRDLLIGVLAGLLCNLILQATVLGGEALGLPTKPSPSWWMDYLLNNASAVSGVLCWFVRGTFICSCLLALLVLLKATLRKGVLAATTLVLFLDLVLVHQETWKVHLVQESLMWGVLTFMAIRFGFLSFIIAWTTLMLLNHFSLTLDTGHFYFFRSVPALIVVLGTALIGYYFTIGGRAGLRRIGLLPPR